MRVLFVSGLVLAVACGPAGGTDAGTGGGGGPSGGGMGGGAQGGGTGGAGGTGGSGGGAMEVDAGPPDAGPISTFVAVGYAGRTTVSCDDGLTWIANKSEDDKLTCFTAGNISADGGTSDCDHNFSPGRGIAYGDGWFVATFGWGAPGSLRRSRDGITWQRTLEGTTFASMVFGNGRFLAASSAPRISSDDGVTWDAGGKPNLMSGATNIGNVRRGGFGGDAGVFVMVGEDGTARDTAISTNNAATWSRPAMIPATCGASMQWEGGIVDGNGVLLMVGGDGVACRSIDNGQTWTAVSLGTPVGSRVVWTGGEFMVWGGNKLFRSSNGATWVSFPLTLKRALPDGGTATEGNLDLGPVARSPGGTFVAVNGGWQTWYDKQLFLRSTDGITWQSLPKTKYTPSHPMTHIVWGPAARSALCP